MSEFAERIATLERKVGDLAPRLKSLEEAIGRVETAIRESALDDGWVVDVPSTPPRSSG